MHPNCHCTCCCKEVQKKSFMLIWWRLLGAYREPNIETFEDSDLLIERLSSLAYKFKDESFKFKVFSGKEFTREDFELEERIHVVYKQEVLV